MATEGLRLGSTWDEIVTWTDELRLGRKHKKAASSPASKSGWTGAAVKPKERDSYPGKGGKADVYKRLTAIAKKHRQVMVKIPKGGRKTARQLEDHFKYLSRENEEVLHDQNGAEITTREGMLDLAWAWKNAGPALDERSDRKEAFHIIFSMHEGTDPRAVFAAAKATAEVEFSGHLWVLAQHTDEDHPHVHIAVKTEALDGTRLNPRKDDLQRWRERFAYELRERGVEAEATRRKTRLHQEKVRTPWAVEQIRKRHDEGAEGPLPASIRPASTPDVRAEGWRRAEEAIGGYYDKLIAALQKSDEESDRQLGIALKSTLESEKARNRHVHPDDRSRDRSQQPQLERS